MLLFQPSVCLKNRLWFIPLCFAREAQLALLENWLYFILLRCRTDLWSRRCRQLVDDFLRHWKQHLHYMSSGWWGVVDVVFRGDVAMLRLNNPPSFSKCNLLYFFLWNYVSLKKRENAMKSAHSSSDCFYALRANSSHIVPRKGPHPPKKKYY